MDSNAPELVITRTFNAPRPLVFAAWSEPERLAKWWGPKGFAIEIHKHEFRPGGTFHYVMRSAGGNEMWGKFVYGEIDAPERMVFVNSFSDAEGGTARSPFSPDWPLEVRNALTLVEEGGKTLLTLRGGPIHATEKERQAFAESVHSMQKGFAGTFEQLDTYLNEAAGEA